jgi:cephalosporin-C deacetylase-like acetyl esterase
MRMKWLGISVGAAVVLLAAGFSNAAQLVIVPDRAGGIYQVGDTVHWQVEWKEESDPPPAHYRLLKGQLTEAGQGDLNFSNKAAGLETRFDAPGAMLVEVKWRTAEGGEGRATGGAVAAPARIALSAPCPDDFDAFWQAKLRELEQTPANPQLEPADIGRTDLAYWKITMGNIRGTHIYGQLARPAQGRRFPALLIVQWGGVYPLQPGWVADRAAEGWLVLNIEPHDLPIDKPEAFYKGQQAGGPLHDYWKIGNDDRETSYYLRMYLSCCRAADYLASRPDWDGKTLVAVGGSQGGMQSLMTAGLRPKITAALAIVPAGCDMLGPVVGRRGGWPQWYANTEGKDPAKVREASRYFDVANFAPRIKCPVLVALGLKDEVCPAEGILAAVNQIRSPKELIIMPGAEHQEIKGSHGAYNRRSNGDWLPALRQGKPAPVNQ